MFLCEFCKIFYSSCSTEHLRTTTFEKCNTFLVTNIMEKNKEKSLEIIALFLQLSHLITLLWFMSCCSELSKEKELSGRKSHKMDLRYRDYYFYGLFKFFINVKILMTASFKFFLLTFSSGCVLISGKSPVCESVFLCRLRIALYVLITTATLIKSN